MKYYSIELKQKRMSTTFNEQLLIKEQPRT